MVRKRQTRSLNDEPVFLFDEDLIGHGKALSIIYPGTIHVSSHGEAPPKETPDGRIYSWCVERDAIFVTADFNMLRDEAVLRELLKHTNLRVIWVRQIKGQSAAREMTRIIGRWPHIRRIVMEQPELRGFVLAGNGRLEPYPTISDVVVEIVRRRRNRDG